MSKQAQEIPKIEQDWAQNPRWKGVKRGYAAADVYRLRGSLHVEHTLVSLTVVPLRDEARTNYVIFFLPFFHVLVSLGWLRAVRGPLGFASLAAACVLGLLALRPVYFQWQEVGKGDFRGAAATIRDRLGEGDGVFRTRTDTTYPFGHYVDWDVPQVNLGRVKEPRFDAHERVWVVAFLPESGVSFGLRRMGDHRAVRTPSENETFVRAEARLAQLGFRRTWERNFPGKNQILVLLYEKVGPGLQGGPGLATVAPGRHMAGARPRRTDARRRHRRDRVARRPGARREGRAGPAALGRCAAACLDRARGDRCIPPARRRGCGRRGWRRRTRRAAVGRRSR